LNAAKFFFRTLVAIGLILSGLTGTVAAAPSMSGSTGMIWIPTADSMRPGRFSAGYYGWGDNQSATVAGVGLSPGLELSAATLWQSGRSKDWTVNAKFSLKQETLLLPAVAVGIEDLAGTNTRSVYAVVSKMLPYGFRVHLGAGSGRFEGMFGGIEKVLNPTKIRKKPSGFPVTSVLAEWDGKTMNYGLRLRLARGLRLDAGWQGRNEKIYWGLSFTH
jgi:hypothetical protein